MPTASRIFEHPRLSPDGRQLAVSVVDGQRQHIHVYDLRSGTFSQVTFEGTNRAPLWTPDGSRLTYASGRGGGQHLFWQPIDRGGPAESLLESPNELWPNGWSADARSLVYTENQPTNNTEIRGLGLDDGRQSTVVPNIPPRSTGTTLSVDGRWLAFVSGGDTRTSPDISVLPFAGPGLRRQLAECGAHPVWRRDGRELFYRYQCGAPANPAGAAVRGDAIFALPFDPVRGGAAGPPVELFCGRFAPRTKGGPSFDVTPDGQRFIVVMASDEELEPSRLDVILNLGDELRRRVPAAR